MANISYLELHGSVVDGDYVGMNVYRWDEESFIIVDGLISSDSSRKLKTLEEISKKTVSNHIVVSTKYESNSSLLEKIAVNYIYKEAGRVQKGSAAHDVAIYFKNGKKCMIRLYYDACLNDIKRILFTLWNNHYTR